MFVRKGILESLINLRFCYLVIKLQQESRTIGMFIQFVDDGVKHCKSYFMNVSGKTENCETKNCEIENSEIENSEIVYSDIENRRIVYSDTENRKTQCRLIKNSKTKNRANNNTSPTQENRLRIQLLNQLNNIKEYRITRAYTGILPAV